MSDEPQARHYPNVIVGFGNNAGAPYTHYGGEAPVESTVEATQSRL